jgi:hypothetical protein
MYTNFPLLLLDFGHLTIGLVTIGVDVRMHMNVDQCGIHFINTIHV